MVGSTSRESVSAEASQEKPEPNSPERTSGTSRNTEARPNTTVGMLVMSRTRAMIGLAALAGPRPWANRVRPRARGQASTRAETPIRSEASGHGQNAEPAREGLPAPGKHRGQLSLLQQGQAEPGQKAQQAGHAQHGDCGRAEEQGRDAPFAKGDATARTFSRLRLVFGHACWGRYLVGM